LNAEQDLKDMENHLSRLYRQDLPPNAVMVLQYPTSFRGYQGKQGCLFNLTKWMLDDQHQPTSLDDMLIEVPHRILAVMGSDMKVFVPNQPEEQMVHHWAEKFGITTRPEYVSLGSLQVPHVTLFPMEALDNNQHAVDPDDHYYVHSKNLIAEIDCVQAKVLEDVQVPCVMKVIRGSNSDGTWIIYSQEEYEKKSNEIKGFNPNTTFLFTELVENVKHTYCAQFYLRKNGEMQWLGVTEDMKHCTDLWNGMFKKIESDVQEKLCKLLLPTVQPVAKVLHYKKYFGVVGVDVLVDQSGKQYVVDINPRVNGSTPLLVASNSMEAKGWTHGITISEIKVYNKTKEEIISTANKVQSGVVVVISMIDKRSYHSCQFFIYSRSICDCFNILHANFLGK